MQPPHRASGTRRAPSRGMGAASPITLVGGKYVLGELLGEGGMGRVYLATQPALERTVAIKLVRDDLVADARVRGNFRREALAAARVSHPSLVTVLDVGETDDGRPFLVMEYVRGRQLGELVRPRPPALRRACDLVAQLLDTLGEVHRAGVIHADVKSDNILLETAHDGHDRLRLIDFGLAWIDAERVPIVCPDGERCISGTPEYLAPEVIRGGPATAASDLYAVGVIFYELLTGTTPFGGGSPGDILLRHLEEPVVPPSLRRPDRVIPRPIEDVIARALAKDPVARFVDADAFAAALARVTPPAARHECPDCGAVIAPEVGYCLPCSATAACASASLGSHESTLVWRAPTPKPAPLPRRPPASVIPHPVEREARLRAAIDAGIRTGDTAAIADAYLALAELLVARCDRKAASRELAEGVSIVACGDDPRRAPAGSPTDRLRRALGDLSPTRHHERRAQRG